MAQLITPEEAAIRLEVDLLAIGQIMFDGKLRPKVGFKFDEEDVDEVKEMHSDYLDTLR